MGYRNYINLEDKILDKPIYRIFPVHRFIEILNENKLTLVKPHKWDDPFENALLKSAFDVSGEIVGIEAKDSVYGQCWTQHRETDAMWRIYSHNKDGIRLSTTPRKLLDALKSSVFNRHPELSCFIGKVQYKNQVELIKALGSISLLNTNGSGLAESLLYKRREFSHEKEVRLIHIGEDGKCSSDIFKFEINPNLLFDRILFDPRMDESTRKNHIKDIRKLGCTTELKRSKLYDSPKGLKFRLI
jgi:hypothetical protein